MDEFVREEEGQTVVDQLLGIIVVVVVTAMIVVIGLSILVQTEVQTQDDAALITDGNISASVISAKQNAFELTDLTLGYAPILVLAAIGGLALVAIAGFLVIRGGGASGGAF